MSLADDILMPLRPLLSRSFHSRSTQSSQLTNLISDARWKYQIWTSRSQDPFLNLSIEHYLLQNTPKDSVVLFLYVNRPCVVIGRNQNPWLEANLRIVGQSAKSGIDSKEGVVQLVRRRSGGGTVFHDEQNVNYSVICPTADFSRDKHAEMVARAMRVFNARARVNERHDIVLDQGELNEELTGRDTGNMHQTAYYSDHEPSLKVSGSAFKLTRHRSLHHGTCLLGSDLDIMRKCFRSDARPFLKARGVDSVRSPVGNVFNGSAKGDKDAFMEAIRNQFRELYGLNNGLKESSVLRDSPDTDKTYDFRDHLQSSIGSEILPAVQNGVDELKVGKPIVWVNVERLLTSDWKSSPLTGHIVRRHSSYFRVIPSMKTVEIDRLYRKVGLHP